MSARTTLEPTAKALEAAHATYEKEVRAAGLAR
jgi:hypothetical protein